MVRSRRTDDAGVRLSGNAGRNGPLLGCIAASGMALSVRGVPSGLGSGMRLLPLLLASSLLSACAAQGSYPSLAPRAIERAYAGTSAPPPCPDQQAAAEISPALTPPQPAPVASDAGLRARLDILLAEARRGQAEFAERLPSASASAGRAGAAGSESWIAAQQEISRLQAARTRTSDALAELNRLGVGRSADRDINDEDYQSVLQAEGEARAIAEQQEAELDRLTSQVGGAS